jgi:hypothetical protein
MKRKCAMLVMLEQLDIQGADLQISMQKSRALGGALLYMAIHTVKESRTNLQ